MSRAVCHPRSPRTLPSPSVMPVPPRVAFKVLISVTDSSAPLSFFFFFVPAAMFSEFFGCRRQDEGAVLVGDCGCGRHAFEWFDERWRCSRCMVVRRGGGQAVGCPGPTAKHTTVTPGAAEKVGHAFCVARVTGDLALLWRQYPDHCEW